MLCTAFIRIKFEMNFHCKDVNKAEESLEILCRTGHQQHIIGIRQNKMKDIPCCWISFHALPLYFLDNEVNGQDKEHPIQGIPLTPVAVSCGVE